MAPSAVGGDLRGVPLNNPPNRGSDDDYVGLYGLPCVLAFSDCARDETVIKFLYRF